MLSNKNKRAVCYSLVLLLSIFNVIHSMDIARISNNNVLVLTIVLEHGPLFFDHAATCNLALVSKKIEESVKISASQRKEYVESLFTEKLRYTEGFIAWHIYGSACCERRTYRDERECTVFLSSYFFTDGKVSEVRASQLISTSGQWGFGCHEIKFGHHGVVSYYAIKHGLIPHIVECSLLPDKTLRERQCVFSLNNDGISHYALSNLAVFPLLLKSLLHSSVIKEDDTYKLYSLENVIIPDNYKEVNQDYIGHHPFNKLPQAFEELPADLRTAIIIGHHPFNKLPQAFEELSADLRTAIIKCYNAQQIKRSCL